jgi:hypothetical protein
MAPPLWVGLQDVEASHREAPRTFSIPRSDQRSGLKPGDVVKLIFKADRPSERGFTAERMWVQVLEAGSSGYVGALDNQPSFLSNLEPGDRVPFGPQHVAALQSSTSGLDLPLQQFALVSRSIAEAGAWPVEAQRHPADTPESSGWVVRCEGPEASDVIRILVGDLIRQFRVLDSVLDEPVGTKWVWNTDRVEYVLQPDGGA